MHYSASRGKDTDVVSRPGISKRQLF